MPLLIAAACLVFLAFLSIVVWTWKTRISPMPSGGKAVRTVCAALDSVIGSSQGAAVFEAGSGWGTLLFAAARTFPSCTFTGYEISPLPFAVSLLFSRLRRSHNVELRRRDFLAADLAGIDIVLTYLHPKGMEKLRNKIEREAAGTVFVVSNNFQFNGWTPVQSLPVYDLYRSKVYVYKLTFG